MLETSQKEAQLRVLQVEIDSRVQQIMTSADAWPCRKGCDACCRSLASLPQATATEWSAITVAMDKLPAGQRKQIEDRIEELGSHPIRPVSCPFLDRDASSCLIYEDRPVACRTYGFYVERDGGLYCGPIQQDVERGGYALVVWGNHAAVEAKLEAIGRPIDVFTWWSG